MRLATFNVENIVRRARVLTLESWSDIRPVIEAHAELSDLLERETYDDAARLRMRDLLIVLGLEKSRRSRFVTLVEQRGELAGMTALRGLRVVARNRADWVGWLDFEMEPLPPRQTFNAAQVLRDVGADIVALQEVESRATLSLLARDAVRSVGGEAYGALMHGSGNDDRGLGLGVIARDGGAIGWSRSHADVRDDRGRLLYERDCLEVGLWTPAGDVLWVINTQLRSRAYGRRDEGDQRRRAQAAQIADVYRRLSREGARYVAVCGDLADTPESDALQPLLRETDLQDVSTHAGFVTDGYVGTYGRAAARDKIDYILLSPALFAKMSAGGVWRRGAWGPDKLPPWDIYPEVKSRYDAASDHAALWCDLAL